MNTNYIDLMVFLVGGPGIAVAVFIAGPSSKQYNEAGQPWPLFKGICEQLFGLQFGGAMGADAENT